jgi:hypothetical protein
MILVIGATAGPRIAVVAPASPRTSNVKSRFQRGQFYGCQFCAWKFGKLGAYKRIIGRCGGLWDKENVAVSPGTMLKVPMALRG